MKKKQKNKKEKTTLRNIEWVDQVCLMVLYKQGTEPRNTIKHNSLTSYTDWTHRKAISVLVTSIEEIPFYFLIINPNSYLYPKDTYLPPFSLPQWKEKHDQDEERKNVNSWLLSSSGPSVGQIMFFQEFQLYVNFALILTTLYL